MSWLGEQFSSFTEKLTDLTKDVLIDSGANASTEDSLPQGDTLSTKQLLDLCKQKDAEIETLMTEKLGLEKSIEELDLQHQEAVDELLYLKNEALKENIALRQELAIERENAASQSLLYSFKHNLEPLGMTVNSDSNCTISEESGSIDNINLINILGGIWKNFNEDTLHSFISVLKDRKHLLDSQVADEDDSSVRNLIHRINNYVRFLRQISENPEVFCPIINEIATVMHFLLSNCQVSAISNSVNDVNRQLDRPGANSTAFTNQETSDFTVQTILNDFSRVKNLFSDMPEPFMCDMAHHESQTDEEQPVPDCYAIIYEMKQYIIMIEMDRDDLQHQISRLEERIQSLSTPIDTESVFVQTDDDYSYNRISESEELNNYIDHLEKENSDLQKEISLLNSMSETCTSSTSIQTAEYDCNCNTPKSVELQTYIDILEQEKSDLQDIILDLQTKFDKPTSTVLIQTESYTCDCDTYELEANICILEQEKSDLQEENLYLQSLIDRPSSSVYVQTEEDLHKYETLLSHLKDMKEILSKKEKTFQNSQQELIKNLDELNEELKSKESFINEKEDVIQSLICQLDDCKAVISDFEKKSNSVESLTSVEVQTAVQKCSCEQYELEISELKKCLNTREREFNEIQNQLTENCNNLTEKLHFAEDNTKSLETTVKNLMDELNTFRNEYSCLSCKKYESEISDLKMYINQKESMFNSTQTEVMNNISDMTEKLKSQDSIINEKNKTIQALKAELEEKSKNNLNLSNELKAAKIEQDYAKDIDTTEECNVKNVVPNCIRCKNIVNRELGENNSSIEVKILQEKLKALDLDKNQLLCVLNEKSQECSSLKAEVHKLTNIVASEKQALYKLQQDNCLLKESRDNCDPELTKEAVKKLSQIIRDKDLEIESLKQKNSTLTTLIQDATSIPDHMQSLIEEKENLSKQINVLKADRDKIMLKYNAIDKDCRQYAAEVKMLKSTLSDQKEKFDVLEQKHFSVAQQYEEKQKSLINTQNEMIALKQRVSDLEQQQVDIKEKYSELLNKFNSDTLVQLSKDELDEKNTKIVQLTSANSEKDHLIQEKDCLILDLSQQIKTLKLEYEQQQSNLSNLQMKVEELSIKLKEQEALVEKIQSVKEALDLRFQDKVSELVLLKEMNERLNMNVKEKEFTIQSMTEKISSLSHYISNDHKTSETVDINQILADSESMFSKAQSLHKERDETLLALSQSKQENQSLRNEIQRMKSNEIHLKKELERLRMHLLEIEENYTTEALKAEEREKDLRDELVEVKRRAEISNTAVVDTNQRASIQIASLQEQLSMIANQRDQALAQVSTLEDKVQQQSASVSKLQLVLEQMQRGNERKIKDTEKKYTALLENQKHVYKELEEKLQAKEMQLEETSHALEAASRLSEQLDAKEEIIANLKRELSKTESKIKSTAQEIDTIKSNTEGKVDRVVMKSLVLGYFSTPPGQKAEVIRLLARVLDFNQEEMEKAGIVVGRTVHRNEQRGGLFASIFSHLPSLSSERAQPLPEQSFSTLFVKFLEHESQPIVPMPFPAEKMTHGLPSKQHPSKKSPTTQRKSLTRSNPLLLDIDSAFPTFTPVPAVEYSQSPAPSILREVLE